MADNAITGKPTKKVSYLSGIKRDGMQLSVTWKVPSGFASSSSKTRAENIGVVWSFAATEDGGKTWGRSRKYSISGISATGTSSSIDLSEVLRTVGRDFFYPTTKTLMYTAKCVVHGYNSKGVGPDVSVTRTFKVPTAPTVSIPELDPETGTLSVEVTCPGDDDEEREVKDAKWVMSAYDGYTKKTVTNNSSAILWGNSEWVRPSETTSGPSYGKVDAGESITLTADIKYWQALEADKRYVKVAFRAFSRGWHGDSATTEQVVYVAKPKKPTFGSYWVGNASNDRVSFGVKLNSTTAFPTTGCRLQIMKDTPYTTAAQVEANLSGLSWADYDEQDDGQCTALSCYISAIKPAVGTYTWVRIHAWNLADVSALSRESSPLRVKELETPTFDSDGTYLAPLEDGGEESVLAYAYWDSDHATDTQFEWSTDTNAWYSTNAPETFQTARATSGSWDISDGSVSHTFTRRVGLYIRGLEVGERVYVRARRHSSDDDTYGKYSQKRSRLIGSAPEGITLSAPGRVLSGKPLPVSWNMDMADELLEKVKWHLYARRATGKPGVEIASGTGGTGYTIPSKKVPSATDTATGEQVTLFLTAGYGGAEATSNTTLTHVVGLPKCKVSTDAMVTAQGATITVKCTEAADSLALVVNSLGSTGDMPWGEDTQAEGDTVWTASLEDTSKNPVWADNTGSDAATYPYLTTVTMPGGLDLRDGARYRVNARATDEGYTGNTATCTFEVSWATKAKAPTATVTPYDVTDSDGIRTRGCTVSCTAGSGMSGTKWDLYRVTPDGAYLVAEDVAYSETVDDPYAPYGSGEHLYRAVGKTSDLDLDWQDWEYDLPGRDMRIDWGTGYVELPYNVVMADTWSKDFEARAHLDGSTEGYWNRAVQRTASLSTDLMRITDRETQTRLRHLATYAGPVFVRLPNSCAYQANVNIGLDEDPRQPGLPVTIDATEVALTDEFRATQPIEQA